MMWTERFQNSDLWQYVDQARTHMNASEAPDGAAEQDALAYVGGVLELVEKRRSESDPREISPTMLSNLASPVSNLASTLEQVNNGAYAWSQVTPYADAVLDAMASWPPLKIAHYLSGMANATEAFQNKVAQAIEDVRERRDGTAEAQEELQAKQTDLRASIDLERQRITESIAEFTTKSAEELQQLRSSQDEALAAELEKWDGRGREAEERADAHVERLRKLEEEARNVVHATTALVVATDYGKYARNKAVAAWICDISAALTGAAGLAVLLYHLVTIQPDADTNIGLSLTRLAVSLGILGVAGLLGRRGHQHHTEARAAKRTELGLRQIMPFTANLEDEERQQVIREFTDRVFIRGDLDTTAQRMPLLWSRSTADARTSTQEPNQ